MRAPIRRCPLASPRFVSGQRRAITTSPQPHPVEWLIIEWPKDEAEPTKYWLSTLAGRHVSRSPCRLHQAALAHRARLRGVEERTRPRPVRRPRLARLPSSRQPLHRGLRILSSRTSRLSPLRPLASQETCRSRSYAIPTLRQSVRNGMWRIRLLRFGSGCLSPSPERSFVVRAVKRRHVAGTSFAVCDAVELGPVLN